MGLKISTLQPHVAGSGNDDCNCLSAASVWPADQTASAGRRFIAIWDRFVLSTPLAARVRHHRRENACAPHREAKRPVELSPSGVASIGWHTIVRSFVDVW